MSRWVGGPVLACAVAAMLALPRTAPAQTSDTLRLDLGSAIRTAARRSTAVELQRLASVRAEARVVDERSGLLPSLSLDASQGQRTFNTASFGLEFPAGEGREPLFDPDGEVVGPVETVDFRLHLSQTLLDWSAWERLRAARASRSASEVREEVAREQAAGRAAVAWIRAFRAQERLDARQEDVALAQQLVEVARQILDAGAGVRIDVTRAEAQLAAMRADRVEARGEVQRSLLALKRALDLPLTRPVALLDSQGDSLAAPRPGLAEAPSVQEALARRPDLRVLDRRIDAASLEVSALESERLPTVSVHAGDGFTGAGYGHLLNTWEWVLEVSVPLFDGFGRGARVDGGRTRISELEIQRTELARDVAFNVRDAVVRLTSARELTEATGSRLTLAEAELAQARERFQAGVTGSEDLVTASLRLNQARTARVDALAGWQEARVSLAAAQGILRELP